MVVGICVSCAELYEGTRLCPRCGGKLAHARRDVLAWEKARQITRIDGWRKEGVIDGATAEQLLARSYVSDAAPSSCDSHDTSSRRSLSDRPAANEPSAIERKADGIVSGAGGLFDEM